MSSPTESSRGGALRAWVRAARPLAQANLALPLTLGVAYALAAGRPLRAWHVAVLTAFSLCDHLFIMFGNDYADRDHDTGARTPFSGGSGVLLDGALAPESLRRGALVAAAGLLGVGAVGVALGRPLLPLASVAAIVLLWAYSYPPLRLSYRGGGATLQAIGVGGVLPWLAHYVVSGDAAAPLPILAPALLLGLAGNFTTALPDVETDRAGDKRTLPVVIGVGRARIVASAVILAAAASLMLLTTAMVAMAVLAGAALPLCVQRPTDGGVRQVLLLAVPATLVWVAAIVVMF